jgi:hypothetical protein
MRGPSSEGDKEGVMRAVVVGVGGRYARRFLLLTGCLVLGVLGLGAVEAHAATPSSLAGETFTSLEVSGSILTGACTGDGNEGSLNFSVSGTADGPFPGTFTESGSFTVAPNGTVSDFSSAFTITSTSGNVTGLKRVFGQPSASCVLLSNGVGLVFTSNLTTVYAATINGAIATLGTATVGIQGSTGLGVNFRENFASVGGSPPPTSQEQCKDGGWRSFGTLFKTQGDCVSFFATGGKNPPSGS